MDGQDIQDDFHFYDGLTCAVLVVSIRLQYDLTLDCCIISHSVH
jgi:hypothetical protein